MVQIKETVDMGEYGSDKIYFCRTGKSYFHTASPLSETFGNIGIVLSFLFKVNIKFKSLFFAGIFFNMLFGLVTSPQHRYLIGLFVFVTLYNVLVIDMYLARRK